MNNPSPFDIRSAKQFTQKALEIFRLQYDTVPVYRKFCDLLKIDQYSVNQLDQIPFLPVELFKTHKILAKGMEPQTIFESSGTTGSTPSSHYIANLELYQHSFTRAFTKFIGKPSEMVILALLPSYLERQGSSLVYMVDQLIHLTGDDRSGFFLDQYDKLIATLRECEEEGKRTLLLGVTYALLDLAEHHKMDLNSTMIMETGGMKGRRKELVRQEVHGQLSEAFGIKDIHSEYGMTELLSQAYSKGKGRFLTPPWMKVLTRDPEDPFAIVKGRTGGINVIDLANRYSCSFIATQDLGRVHNDDTFEVIGRFDHSDIRGCNLMAL